MALDNRSLVRLKAVHPDLAMVIMTADSLGEVPFIVTEGLRSKERQIELVKAGASKTMTSRHLTGHAVDLAVKVGNEVRWDWPLYAKLAATVKKAAAQRKVSIVWGGDWKTFKDGPHFELDRTRYP
jgi:peptidoglycan LD-endopeptidase CwlK